MNFIITLFGLARSIPTLAEYYKKIKAKINFPSVFEDILYNSMKTAVKEVTGQDVSDLDLTEKVEIYEAALLFFEDPTNNIDRLKQLFYSSNCKITEIENHFIKNLINNGGVETITFLLTQLIPKADRIEEGVGRIEKEISSNDLKLDQIQSSIKDVSRFFEEINKSLKPKPAEKEGKFQLDDKMAFYEAPKIPENFIKRTETLSGLDKLLDKQILFIHGITRSGKSFLISEFINVKELNYFWYDFKLNETNEDNFFYLLLSKYITKDNTEINLEVFLNGVHFNFQAIADALNNKANSLSNFCFVLDNIQISKHIAQLDSFLKLLLEKSEKKIFVILISEEKDVYKLFSSNIHNINEFHSTGFSINEMRNYFEENGISTKDVSKNFLEMIHYNSSYGHPDIINGLISELKNRGVNTLLSAVVVNQVMNSFKGLAAQQKIIKVLSEKIFTNILKTEEQKNLFIRLSCLIGTFTNELALILSSLNPPILNFHLIFPFMSEKLFDIYPESKYSIPKIFKDTAREYLTDELKSTVFLKTADYLSTPQNGVLNFNDGELACTYLFIAKQTKAAIALATELLRRILIKYNEKNYIKDGLQKFELYVELPINDEYINEQVDLLVMTLEAYKIIGDKPNTKKISEKIYTSLSASKLNPREKYFASLVLLFSYFFEKEVSIEKIIVCLNNCFKAEDKDFLPIGSSEFIDREKILKGVFISLLVKEIPRLKDFNKFLKSCLENNILIADVIDNAFIVDIFNVLWSNLYKSLKSSNDVAGGLKSVSSDLDESIIIFRELKFIIAIREINHLLGLLHTDLADNPLGSIQYFNLAKESNDTLKLRDEDFLAKNYLTIGDACFKAKKHELAVDNYLISEQYFRNVANENLLKVHNLIRLGISYYESGDASLSEKYFWKAFKLAKNAEEKNIELIFRSLAEMSTYYIKTEKYLKAAKCFSIILSLLNHLEYSAKHQLVAQSLTWLYNSKKDNTLYNEKFNRKNKEFVKPFWGMYNNPTYIAPEATKSTTYYMLAETFSVFEVRDRAASIFKKIVTDSGNKTFELSAKYLSVVNLITFSLNNKKFEDLLFCFENIIPLLYEFTNCKDLEFQLKSLESPSKDAHGAIKFFFIDHIKVKYVKKYEELEMFAVVEKFFMKLIEILKEFEFDFVEKVFAELTSAFGWFYGLNFSLNKNNRNTSLSWLTVSNEKALPNGMMEVFFNNKNMELFYVPVVHDLRKYFNDVFEYLYFAKDHLENKEIMDALLNSFKNFINMMHNDNATSNDLKILHTIKESLKYVRATNDHPDNFIFLVIGLLKIRLIINYDKQKAIICYKFLLENLKPIHKSEIDEIITNYFSLHNDLIRKSISNDEYVKSLNEEMKGALIRFINEKKNIISQDLLTKIEVKIEELS